MIKKNAEINIKSNANETAQGVSNIKKELRLAKEELIKSQGEFGDYSKEAIEAAKRVAQLRDTVQEANETAALFDPGAKFSAITGALSAVAGGFSVVTGAMGMLGAESEEVEQMILKVNSALALSTGLSSIADSAKDFNRLGTIASQAFTTIKTSATTALNGIKTGILATGIGAFVIALGLIAANWDDIKKSVQGAADANKVYKDIQGEVSEKLKDTFQNLQNVKSALAAAKEGTLSKEQALKTYNEKLGDTLGKTDNLEVAEMRLAKNTGKYLQAMQARATSQILYGKAAELAARMATGEDVELGFWDGLKAEIAGITGLAGKAYAISSAVSDKRNESQSEYNKLLEAANKEQEKAFQIESEFGAEDINKNYDKDKKDKADALAKAKADAAKALADKKANDEAYLQYQRNLKKQIEDLEDDSEQKKLNRQKEREDAEINALKGKTDIEKQILIDASNEKFKILQAQLDKESQLKKEAKQKEIADSIAATQKEIQEEIDSNVVRKSISDAHNQSELDAIYIQLQKELDARQAAQLLEFSNKQAANLLKVGQEYGFGIEYQNLKAQQAADLNSLIASQNNQDVQLKEESTDKKIELDKAYQAANKSHVKALIGAMDSLAASAGENTAAGKALGIASATINTFIGISEVWAAKSMGNPILDMAVKVASTAAVATAGIMNVKKIMSVKIPKAGGGGSGGGASAPTAPPKPSVNFQNTPQTQITDSIERSTENRNSQPQRVYLTTGDVLTAESLERNRINSNTF